MLREGYANNGNVKIFYRYLRKTGRPCLVFLHGGSGSISSSFLQEAFFSKMPYSLLFVDMRGHGKSDRGFNKDFFRIHNFSNDVKAVMDKLGLKKATVIAHCFGSFVAQDFACKFPQCVERMVLINSAAEPMDNVLLKFPVSLFFKIVGLIPYNGKKGYADYSKHVGSANISIRRIKDDVKFCGTKTWAEVVLQSFSFKTHLDRCPFNKPALVMHGKADMIVNPSQGTKLHNLLPKSDFVLLDTNHVSVFNCAPAVNSEIIKFLKKPTSAF